MGMGPSASSLTSLERRIRVRQHVWRQRALDELTVDIQGAEPLEPR